MTRRSPTRAAPKRSQQPAEQRVSPSAVSEPGAQPRSASAAHRGIERHRLLERLSVEPRPRLIVIQGPAGYGKTSLLRQHCDRRAALGERIAWVRMDAQSADAAHLLRRLCDAVESLAGKPIKSVERPATLQDLLRALARLQEPLVLVVDNFETAASAPFESVFAQIVRSLPLTVQLCVGTRVLPGARLARLQIRESTVVLSNEELCFRPSETIEFLREFADLRPEEIADIHERTGGWPAALQAFRLCLRRGARFRAEAYAGRGITRELMDYLAAEAFDQLAPRCSRP